MEHIRYEISNRMAIITLNRPEKRNALHVGLVTELLEAFTEAGKNDQVKIIILAAEGEAFCAGADLAYLQHLQRFTYEENLADSTQLKNLFLTMYTLPKVIVARIQGPALAGGCGLVTACDFAVASATAKFGYTEVCIGFVPALVTPFLVRKIGEGRARQMLLSGQLLTAHEAAQWGLISHITEPEKLMEETLSLAHHLVGNNSAESMATTKALLHQTATLELEEALNLAARTNAMARASADCQRGIAAFLNKEKIMW